MCSHVYEFTNVGLCNLCNKPTHDIDWAREHALKKEHIETHGFLYNAPSGWWSI